MVKANECVLVKMECERVFENRQIAIESCSVPRFVLDTSRKTGATIILEVRSGFMEQNSFPIPISGQVEIVDLNPSEFIVECTNINRDDHKRLQGFFCRMHGRFGEFRFEHGDVIHPICRFDSDSLTFAEDGTELFDLTFPIKILPRN